MKNHLGNNHVVSTLSGSIMQTNHYYPYGANLTCSTNQSRQQYKYNGNLAQRSHRLSACSPSGGKLKNEGDNNLELDRTHGLNWYDYIARQYDAELGQFTSMDDFCEKYYHISPYVYCGGNPISRVDPDGRQFGDYFNMQGNYLGSDGIDDKKIFIVENNKECKQIKKNGGQVEQGSLSSAKDIGNVTILEASLDVLDRTINNGVTKEECSVVNDKDDVTLGKASEYAKTAFPIVDNPVASIHSHAWEIQEKTHLLGTYTERMSPEDALAFRNYDMNVIVGTIVERKKIPVPDSYNKYELTPAKLGASFYHRNTTDPTSTYAPYISVSRDALKKIKKYHKK